MEILKALYRQADILILDEPTGVLTPAEADHLFRILKGLRDQGKTIILITHKLREIMETTDNVSVMRRGTMVGTVKTAETSPEELAELMVGRKVLLEVEKKPATPGRGRAEVQDLRVRDEHGVERLKGVSFDIRAGEILGIAGVAGNGQSELLAALGGIADGDRADRAERGRTCRCRGIGAERAGAARGGHRPCARGPAGAGPDHGFHRLGERGLRLSQRAGVPEERAVHGQRRAARRHRAQDGDLRRAPADPDAGRQELLGREPAEDRRRARDRAAIPTCC